MGRRKEPRPPTEKATAKAQTRQSAAKPEKAFDLWLDRGLHTLFDSVAAEPIPEDLLRLIEEDRKE